MVGIFFCYDIVAVLNPLSVLCIIQYSIRTVDTVYMEDYLSLLYATETGRMITYNHSNIVELAPMFSKYVVSAISEVHTTQHVDYTLWNCYD